VRLKRTTVKWVSTHCHSTHCHSTHCHSTHCHSTHCHSSGPGQDLPSLGRRSEAGSALRRVPASVEVTIRLRVVGSSWLGDGGLYGLGDNDGTGHLGAREVARVAGLVDVQHAVADVQVLHGGAVVGAQIPTHAVQRQMRAATTVTAIMGTFTKWIDPPAGGAGLGSSG
jgi:hypothetical protein